MCVAVLPLAVALAVVSIVAAMMDDVEAMAWPAAISIICASARARTGVDIGSVVVMGSARHAVIWVLFMAVGQADGRPV